MKTLKVYFDENCHICNRTRLILKPIVRSEICIFLFAKDLKSNDQINKIKYVDLISYDGEKYFAGYETYLEIFRRSYLLYILYLFMNLKIVTFFGKKIYTNISSKRTCRI